MKDENITIKESIAAAAFCFIGVLFVGSVLANALRLFTKGARPQAQEKY
jgi:hypothetical protein